MYYTIYKVTNNLNNKIYIGKHQTSTIDDSYFGSGKAIVNAMKKHGKHNFSKEILFIFDTEAEMNAKEQELITEEFVVRPDTYNLGVGGEGGPHFKGKKHSVKTKEKISIKGIGRKHNVETRKNISEKNKEFKASNPDERFAMSSLGGKKCSEYYDKNPEARLDRIQKMKEAWVRRKNKQN